MQEEEIQGLSRSVEHEVKAFTTSTEHVINTYRQSVLRRFPVLFALLVTFGVAATIFGMERIISEVLWLNERPWLILTVGLIILVATGKLYKKLG